MSQQRSATVTALTIAGSDPSGGAGIQADMKAMSALGSYAMSVITALTAQSTRGVAGVHAVPVEFVRLQMDTLLEDIVPDATKIGMLATAELADAVGEYLPGLTHRVGQLDGGEHPDLRGIGDDVLQQRDRKSVVEGKSV